MWYILWKLSPIDNKKCVCARKGNGMSIHYESNELDTRERWKLINSLFNVFNKNRSTLDSVLFNFNASHGPTDRARDKQTDRPATVHIHSPVVICPTQIITRETVYTDLFAYLHSINVKR